MGLYAHFTNISLVSGFVSLVPFLTHIMSKSFKTEHLSQCIVIPHIICICILHYKHIFYACFKNLRQVKDIFCGNWQHAMDLNPEHSFELKQKCIFHWILVLICIRIKSQYYPCMCSEAWHTLQTDQRLWHCFCRWIVISHFILL